MKLIDLVSQTSGCWRTYPIFIVIAPTRRGDPPFGAGSSTLEYKSQIANESLIATHSDY